ncbi:MAG TPA: 50S ribosomal protein L30 [Bacillota bacterium]|jgi:large subunit ribosomal protein L30
MAKQVRITLVRSLAGRPQDQRVIVRTLGLRRMNDQVIQEDSPSIRGMIDKVTHLLKVEEVGRA